MSRLSPAKQIVEAEQALYKLSEQGQTERGFVSFLKAVTEAVNSANAAYQREGGLAGISTGLIDMDKKARRAAPLRPPDPRRTPPRWAKNLSRHQHRLQRRQGL